MAVPYITRQGILNHVSGLPTDNIVVGEVLRIVGINFGAAVGRVILKGGGADVDCLIVTPATDWTDTQIIAKMPPDPPKASILIVEDSGGTQSSWR